MQHPFLIQSGCGGNIPQHDKGQIWQGHCQHHSQREKPENFSYKIRNKTKASTLTTSTQNSIRSSSLNNLTRKRNKSHLSWKEVKLSLHADDILYTENPKSKILLEVLLCNVARHELDIQKSLAFLYTNNAYQKKKLTKQSYLLIYDCIKNNKNTCEYI